MEDLFFNATSNLDKLLDEFEEREAPAVKSTKLELSKKNQQHEPALFKPLPLHKKDKQTVSQSAVMKPKKLENAPVLAPNVSNNEQKSNLLEHQDLPNDNLITDDLLIDFSVPDITSTTSPKKGVSNTLAHLDFLLPVIPHDNSTVVEEPTISAANEIPIVVSNLSDSKASGDSITSKTKLTNSSLRLLNDQTETQRMEDLPVNSLVKPLNDTAAAKLNESEFSKVSSDVQTLVVSPQFEISSQTNVLEKELTQSSTRIGFDDVHVDVSEFDKFMQESDHTVDSHQTESLLESSEISNSIPNSEQAFSKPAINADENATSLQHLDVNATELTSNSSNESRPKLKKLFHKDIKAQANHSCDQKEFASIVNDITIPEDIAAAFNANAMVADRSLIDISSATTPWNSHQNKADAQISTATDPEPYDITLTNNAATTKPINFQLSGTNGQRFTAAENTSLVTEQLVDIAPSVSEENSTSNSDFEPTAILPQDVQSNVASNTSPSLSAQQDVVSQSRPSSLSFPNQERELQRIPSVSPPSYSSVIAGEYNAGTIVEEGQPVFSSAVGPSRIQQDGDASVEQAVEATEDNTQVSVPTAERPNTPDSRQRLPNVNYQGAVVQRPGDVKPHWMPDEERSSCCKCNVKFTFTRRRHHCRACGHIFCSSCCSEKSKLAYLKHAEARVCIDCNMKILQVDAYVRLQSANQSAVAATPPSSSASVPISVMRTDNSASGANSAPKSVRFSDGTKPDHPDVLPATPPPPPVRAPRSSRLSKRTGPGASSTLPPLVIEQDVDGSCTVDEEPDFAFVVNLLKTNGNHFLIFALSANLFVMVKIVQYSSSSFYYFLSSGLDSVGHCEVAILLQIDNNNDTFPMQAFNLYTYLFNAARKGKAIQANDFLPLEDFATQSENVFGSNDYAGLIFVRRTVQNIESLSLEHAGESSFLACPTVQFSSTLFALLVRKSEVSWAKLFYSRLLLGLGAKYKQYPYPLVNYHSRSPLCFEVGNTILGILCDFRNFKYKVVTVAGLSVFITKGGVIVNIPCNRFVDVTKIMNSSNEHVVALGSDTFLSEADCNSHLVCLQDETKHTYHSQVLSDFAFQNEDDGCVGAAFVVFNGSLKSGSTQQARCSIVEDGVMIQLLPEKMAALKEALKAVEDFRISCGASSPAKHAAESVEQDTGVSSTSSLQENVNQFMEVRWVSEDTKFNIGLSSPIDFQSLEGVVGYNVQGKSEKKGKHHVLRWNQVFFFKSTSDILDMSRLAERVANGCIQALAPHVKLLRDSHQTKIGVRVNIHPDDVGYAVGSRGLPLPDVCLNALDDGLIPLTHEASSSLHVEDDPVIFELIFSVLDIRSSWNVAAK